MSNAANERNWLQKNKQTVALTVVAVLLVIFAGVAIYASVTTQFHMI
jgi:hypothetical protein